MSNNFEDSNSKNHIYSQLFHRILYFPSGNFFFFFFIFYFENLNIYESNIILVELTQVLLGNSIQIGDDAICCEVCCFPLSWPMFNMRKHLFTKVREVLGTNKLMVGVCFIIGIGFQQSLLNSRDYKGMTSGWKFSWVDG